MIVLFLSNCSNKFTDNSSIEYLFTLYDTGLITVSENIYTQYCVGDDDMILSEDNDVVMFYLRLSNLLKASRT